MHISDIIRSISNQFAQKLPGFHATGIFTYGSAVYGYKPADDNDLIYVITADNFVDRKDQVSFPEFNTDVTLYSHDRFLKELADHEISALECMYLPKQHVHVLHPMLGGLFNNVPINKGVLRSSISKKCSNSYVKAKKKLTVKEDYDLACSVKSLFHSFRMYTFGQQLAEHGKITDYAAANQKYIDVLKCYQASGLDWEKIHAEIRPLFNETASEFKKHAPKETT